MAKVNPNDDDELVDEIIETIEDIQDVSLLEQLRDLVLEFHKLSDKEIDQLKDNISKEPHRAQEFFADLLNSKNN